MRSTDYQVDECVAVEYVDMGGKKHDKTHYMVCNGIAYFDTWKLAQSSAKRMSENNPDIVFRFDGSGFDYRKDQWDFYYLNGKRISRDHAENHVIDMKPAAQYMVYNALSDGTENYMEKFINIIGAINSARYSVNKNGWVIVRHVDGKLIYAINHETKQTGTDKYLSYAVSLSIKRDVVQTVADFNDKTNVFDIEYNTELREARRRHAMNVLAASHSSFVNTVDDAVTGIYFIVAGLDNLLAIKQDNGAPDVDLDKIRSMIDGLMDVAGKGDM